MLQHISMGFFYASARGTSFQERILERDGRPTERENRIQSQWRFIVNFYGKAFDTRSIVE